MEAKKDVSIFSVIRTYWQRNPTLVTRLDTCDKQNEHKDAYQNTYSNFLSKSDPARQILPGTAAEEKEPADPTIQDVAFHYCNEATVHGIRHLIPSSNKIRRFAYLVIVLVFTGVLLKFLLGILIVYSTNPYKTYYYAEMMQKQDFPTVTMCNLENMLSFNTTYEWNQTMESILQNYIPDIITIEECDFNGNKCYETIPTVMIIRQLLYGCYIIRPAINRTCDMEDLKSNDGLAVDVTTQKSWKQGEKGVRVFLHEDKTYPSQMDSSFFAGPRDATFAAIQPEKVEKLGTPYHTLDEDCRHNESPSFENPLKFYKYYSQTNCQRECTSLYIEEYCNCTIPYFPGNSRPCTFYDYKTCVKLHMNASMSEETYLYRCKCTPNCSYLQYDSRVSVAQMRYGKHTNEDMFRIRIYFENMVMKFLKEKPKYELEDLLSSFGGQMGLFIGASIISVYEFVEFLVIFVWTFFTSYFRKSESHFKRTAAVRKKTPIKNK